MQTPLDIRFHNLDPSDALSEKIRQKVEKLERFYGRVTSCTVVLEMPHHSKTKGNEFRIRIELGIPQEILIVDRATRDIDVNRSAHILIRDAFDAMRRKLQSTIGRKQDPRIDRLTPEEQEIGDGVVAKIFPGDGYGFIQTADDREIYFHENALTNETFERIEIGHRVRFHEEAGVNGPQATYVALTSRQVQPQSAAV